MTYMEPLRQFICDTCGELITEPDQGFIEWETDYVSGRKARNFKIVHHALHSPRVGEGCYVIDSASAHLQDMLGDRGIVRLINFIDVGEYLQPDYRGPDVNDLREFTEFMRRLTIPHYEEAKMYWADAMSAGDFDGANANLIYSPEFSRRIIDRYKPQRG
jgi:hypothetical protein